MYNQDLKKLSFHILIIDDDQKIRELLKKFLENNSSTYCNLFFTLIKINSISRNFDRTICTFESKFAFMKNHSKKKTPKNPAPKGGGGVASQA